MTAAARDLHHLAECEIPHLTVVTREHQPALMLGVLGPKRPLAVRMAWLRTWSALLREPITWASAPSGLIAGYLEVRASRPGMVAVCRVFLTQAEAQGVDLLLAVAEGSES